MRGVFALLAACLWAGLHAFAQPVKVTPEMGGAGAVSSGVGLPAIPALTGSREKPVASWGKPLAHRIYPGAARGKWRVRDALAYYHAIGMRIERVREWAYGRSHRNSAERLKHLPRWLHAYNWHRPHSSLGGAVPISRPGLGWDTLLSLHI